MCRYRELDDVTAPSVAVHIDVNVDGTAPVAEEQVHLLLEVLNIVLGVALHFRKVDVHANRSGRRLHLGLVPKELAHLVHGLLRAVGDADDTVIFQHVHHLGADALAVRILLADNGREGPRSKLNLPIDFTGRSEELLVILISVDRDRLEIVPRSEIRLRS